MFGSSSFALFTHCVMFRCANEAVQLGFFPGIFFEFTAVKMVEQCPQK